MKNFLKIIFLSAFIAPGLQLQAQAELALDARQMRQHYADQQRELRHLRESISELNLEIARGKKSGERAGYVSGTGFVVSVVVGALLIRSGNGKGSSGCANAFFGALLGGIGTIVSVGGGYMYLSLNSKEIAEVTHRLELKELELAHKMAAADEYLASHPVISEPVSPEQKAKEIYDEDIRNIADLQKVIKDLEQEVSNGDTVSMKTILIGGSAVAVSIIAGKWVFRSGKIGFWGFIGKVGSYASAILSGAMGSAYWYFNHQDVAQIKARLADRQFELESKKAAVDAYLRVSPQLQGSHQKP